MQSCGIDVQLTAGGIESGLSSTDILQRQIVNEARDDDISECEIHVGTPPAMPSRELAAGEVR
jgi:hypothetical protein